MNVRYEYRVYDNTNQPLGELPNIISRFNPTQSINTAGPSLDVEIGQPFDEAGATVDVDLLVDENGDYVLDQNGDNIQLRVDYLFEDLPIDLNNRVKVYEFSDWNPNGKLRFDGFIFSWNASLTGQTIKLLLLNWGARLDQVIINPASDLAVSQTTYNSTFFLNPQVKGEGTTIAQSFTLASDILASDIQLYIQTTSTTAITQIACLIFEGNPVDGLGSFMAIGGGQITVGLTPEPVTVTFSLAANLIAGTEYTFFVQNTGSETSFYAYPSVAYNSTSVYANGIMYTGAIVLGSTVYTATTGDVAFVLGSTDGSVSATFANYNPSDIIRSSLNVFNSIGEIITYDDDSVDDTSISLTYTFLLATVLENINKAFQLAGSTWCWYIDITTNLLHFHDIGQTADHIFTIGNHIADLEFSRTMENMTNYVAFSGGETAPGVNLFRVISDSESINTYGQWLLRLSDNRVTLTDTADLLSLAQVGRWSQPTFNVQDIVIPISKYDISSINLGQMISARNANEVIDSLLLQVVELKWDNDSVTIRVGVPAPKASKTIEDLRRRMIQQETVNNPDTPTE